MKVLLTILLLFSCFFSLAQEKQEKWNVEIGWKPFNTAINHIGVDRVGVKLAISNRINVRMLFQYSQIKEHKELNEPQPLSSSLQTEYENKERSHSFAPGVEYVFFRNSAISAYAGIELLYAVKKTRSEVYRQRTGKTFFYVPDSLLWSGHGTEATKIIVKGLQYEEEIRSTPATLFYRISYHNPSYTLLGAQVPLGVNINLYKKLYAGLELKLFYHRKVIDEVQIYEDKLIKMEKEQLHTIANKKLAGAKAHSFGIYFDNSVRLGIRF